MNESLRIMRPTLPRSPERRIGEIPIRHPHLQLV